MCRPSLLVLISLSAACASSTPVTRPVAPPADPDAIPAWLLPADACPADVARATEVPSEGYAGVCETHLDSCMTDCQASIPTACQAAGYQMQALGRLRVADALYLRACSLGNASGCTNRAAGLLANEPDLPDGAACAARTFEITCRQHDPWGCTMFGRALATGEGVPMDVERALAILPLAGVEDETFDACTAARELMTRIQASPAAP
jgi:hypothetical protein